MAFEIQYVFRQGETGNVSQETRSVFFDAVTRIQHKSSGSATTHTVETGVDVTDHFRPSLDQLTVEAWVSNTPLASGPLGGAFSELEVQTTLRDISKTANKSKAHEETISTKTLKASVVQYDDRFDRVGDVYRELRSLMRDAFVLTVVTTERDYESMLLTSIDVPRDAKSGGGAAFSMTFQELRTAETQTIEAPEPLEPRGERRERRGGATTEEPTETETESVRASMASNALNSETVQRLLTVLGG